MFFFNCLKDSRDRSNFNILPIDGAQACRPMGQDRRQLGLEREGVHIMNQGNRKKKDVTFGENFSSSNINLAILSYK